MRGGLVLEGERVDDLTAVIVTYNSRGFLKPCVQAVQRWTRRVIVVDNGSTDGTLEEAAGTELIANPINRGFAGAANQGFRAAATPYVLLLNPDVVVETGRDDLMAAAAEGAATGLLVGPDGQPQRGFTLRRLPSAAMMAAEVLGLNRLWPANPFNRRYRCLDCDLTQPQDAEQPPGAFLMVRREAWRAVGGWDERFHPIWFEDVDFCKRLRDGGWRVRYTPASRARHSGGHSIRHLTGLERQVQWYVSLLRYAEKHFGAGGYYAVCLSVALSSFPRALIGVLRTGRVEHLQIGIEVAKNSARQFIHARPSRLRALVRPAVPGERGREIE